MSHHKVWVVRWGRPVLEEPCHFLCPVQRSDLGTPHCLLCTEELAAIQRQCINVNVSCILYIGVYVCVCVVPVVELHCVCMSVCPQTPPPFPTPAAHTPSSARTLRCPDDSECANSLRQVGRLIGRKNTLHITAALITSRCVCVCDIHNTS